MPSFSRAKPTPQTKKARQKAGRAVRRLQRAVRTRVIKLDPFLERRDIRRSSPERLCERLSNRPARTAIPQHPQLRRAPAPARSLPNGVLDEMLTSRRCGRTCRIAIASGAAQVALRFRASSSRQRILYLGGTVRTRGRVTCFYGLPVASSRDHRRPSPRDRHDLYTQQCRRRVHHARPVETATTQCRPVSY